MKHPKCLCCKREIKDEVMSNRKYCLNCKDYVDELKRQIRYYKNKAERFSIKLYGVKNGAERIR